MPLVHYAATYARLWMIMLVGVPTGFALLCFLLSLPLMPLRGWTASTASTCTGWTSSVASPVPAMPLTGTKHLVVLLLVALNPQLTISS